MENISIIAVAIFTLLFTLQFVVIEYMKRTYVLDSELTRKMAHVLSGIGAIIASYFLNQTEFLLVLIIFFFVFLINMRTKSLTSVHLTTRKTAGEVFFTVGLLILTLIHYGDSQVFRTGVLLLAIPDAVVGYAGYHMKLKKHSYIRLLTYFVISFMIMYPVFSYHGGMYALVLTVVEVFSPFGLDNLTVPLVYSVLALL